MEPKRLDFNTINFLTGPIPSVQDVMLALPGHTVSCTVSRCLKLCRTSRLLTPHALPEDALDPPPRLPPALARRAAQARPGRRGPPRGVGRAVRVLLVLLGFPQQPARKASKTKTLSSLEARWNRQDPQTVHFCPLIGLILLVSFFPSWPQEPQPHPPRSALAVAVDHSPNMQVRS